MHLLALENFGLQLEGGLKAIDDEPQRPVDLAELGVGLCSHEPHMAHRLAHHGSIFLLDMALIVLDRRASARKGEVFLLTIGDQFLIEELRAAIGVNAKPRETGRACGPARAQRAPHWRSFPAMGCTRSSRWRDRSASGCTESSLRDAPHNGLPDPFLQSLGDPPPTPKRYTPASGTCTRTQE